MYITFLKMFGISWISQHHLLHNTHELLRTVLHRINRFTVVFYRTISFQSNVWWCNISNALHCFAMIWQLYSQWLHYLSASLLSDITDGHDWWSNRLNGSTSAPHGGFIDVKLNPWEFCQVAWSGLESTDPMTAQPIHERANTWHSQAVKWCKARDMGQCRSRHSRIAQIEEVRTALTDTCLVPHPPFKHETAFFPHNQAATSHPQKQLSLPASNPNDLYNRKKSMIKLV